jgi:prevent-host-death family protein
MKFVSVSRARSNLAALIDDPERAVITKNGEPAAVLIDFEEYRAMRADLLLLRDPEQLRAVIETLDAVKKGDFSDFHDLPNVSAPPKRRRRKKPAKEAAGAPK